MTVLRYNPWNQSAEPGDIMVSHDGQAWRLFERKHGPRACAGELSMYPLEKPGHRADIKEEKLVWIAAAEFEEARLRILQQAKSAMPASK